MFVNVLIQIRHILQLNNTNDLRNTKFKKKKGIHTSHHRWVTVGCGNLGRLHRIDRHLIYIRK